MGKIRSVIDDAARKFIEAQHLFFVATAPLAESGHVNLSPKGMDTFRVLEPSRVGYLDFNGSGVETIAHLKENGRIVLMFCAFEGPPNILRLYGRGRAVVPDEAAFPELVGRFPKYSAPRSVIVVEVDRVADSCGLSIPRFKYVGERSQLEMWARKKGPEGLKAYREKNNRRSIDGLLGIEDGLEGSE